MILLLMLILLTLMEQYNAGDKEIWLTETGYATMPIDVYGNSIVPADGTNAKKYCVSELISFIITFFTYKDVVFRYNS